MEDVFGGVGFDDVGWWMLMQMHDFGRRGKERDRVLGESARKVAMPAQVGEF